MKRKFKLFATVASLCLSVALMAFGVYAAASVTYNVSGTVSYTMDHALVSVTTTVYSDTTQHGGFTSPEEDTLAGLTWGAATNTYTFKTYNDSTHLPEESGLKDQPVTIDLNTASAWKIEISITSINENGVNITPSSEYAISGSSNFAILAAEENSTGLTGVKDTAKVLTYYVYLINPVVAINAATFDISVDIAKA